MPRPNSIVVALRRLGESTAGELADHLERESDNVKEQIRQMLARAEPVIRETGRTGAGGTEPIYELVDGPGADREPEGDWGAPPAANGATPNQGIGQVPEDDPVALEIGRLGARVRGLESANERVERERDAALEQVETLEESNRMLAERLDGGNEEKLRQYVDELAGIARALDVSVAKDESIVATVPTPRRTGDAVAKVLEDLNDAQRALADTAGNLEERAGWANLTQGELDDVAEELGLPKDGPHGALLEAVRAMKNAPPDDARLVTRAAYDELGAKLEEAERAVGQADAASKVLAESLEKAQEKAERLGADIEWTIGVDALARRLWPAKYDDDGEGDAFDEGTTADEASMKVLVELDRRIGDEDAQALEQELRVRIRELEEEVLRGGAGEVDAELSRQVDDTMAVLLDFVEEGQLLPGHGLADAARLAIANLRSAVSRAARERDDEQARGMRQDYFDVILEKVKDEPQDELLDRLERLIDGPHGGDGDGAG